MRVIAGLAGGIHLTAPRRGVRPTMDRVKAAIFSSLGEQIIGANVLDLFAGTGALGIEALSRGAGAVLFVEEGRQAVAAIEKNLATTKLQGRVRQQEAFQFLKNAGGREKFDLIFADPPYEKTKSGETFTDLLVNNEGLARLLCPDGTFVLEKTPEEILTATRFWEIVRRKAYGATEVLFLQHSNPVEGVAPQE